MKIGTMFYTPGHVDKEEFWDVLWHAVDCDTMDILIKIPDSNVRHRYMRETFGVRTIYNEPGQGASPVTVLDLGYNAK